SLYNFAGPMRVTRTGMRKLVGAACGTFVLSAGVFAQNGTAPRAAQPAAPKPALAVAHTTDAAADPEAALVKQYCAGCHSEKGKSGGLSLATFDPTHAEQTADVAEKMIR